MYMWEVDYSTIMIDSYYECVCVCFLSEMLVIIGKGLLSVSSVWIPAINRN